MMVARRTPGAGVRKPPKEETAGGVTKLRVRRYGIWTLAACCRGELIASLGSSRRGGEPCRPVATGRTGGAHQRSNDRTAVPGRARAILIIAGQEAAIQKGRAGVSPRIDFDHDVSILITAVDAAGR